MRKSIIIFIVLLPFLLANKDCQRSTTWGKTKQIVASSLATGHPEIDVDTACTDCHDDISKTKPANHKMSWEREHGKIDQLQFGYQVQSLCYKCHNESTCSQCHEQNKPKNHTQHFRLKGHGVMVGLDRSACTTCHKADFCDRCHSQTSPASHNALWGSTQNRHCVNCHLPLTGSTAEQCSVCHAGTPSHASATAQPANGFHAPGADCRSCHVPLTQHADNGTDCETCHQ
ncbi:MAG: hypothetical protein ABII18_02535 [bacterium]|nr:hypothetical protein [bacterium]MBU1916586.1 hypothetical protein [bacterium]